MQFEFLHDRKDAIPIIGRWYHREWGQRLRGDTEERSIRLLDTYLNTDRIPFILVATDGDRILGCAQLKFREMEDLYPDNEHWLGGVYVGADFRGHGLGSKLADEIARRAPAHGAEILYLQTEQLDGGLYRRLGWRPIEQVNNRGLEVLVMERAL